MCPGFHVLHEICFREWVKRERICPSCKISYPENECQLTRFKVFIRTVKNLEVKFMNCPITGCENLENYNHCENYYVFMQKKLEVKVEEVTMNSNDYIEFEDVMVLVKTYGVQFGVTVWDRYISDLRFVWYNSVKCPFRIFCKGYTRDCTNVCHVTADKIDSLIKAYVLKTESALCLCAEQQYFWSIKENVDPHQIELLQWSERFEKLKISEPLKSVDLTKLAEKL